MKKAFLSALFITVFAGCHSTQNMTQISIQNNSHFKSTTRLQIIIDNVIIYSGEVNSGKDKTEIELSRPVVKGRHTMTIIGNTNESAYTTHFNVSGNDKIYIIYDHAPDEKKLSSKPGLAEGQNVSVNSYKHVHADMSVTVFHLIVT